MSEQKQPLVTGGATSRSRDPDEIAEQIAQEREIDKKLEVISLNAEELELIFAAIGAVIERRGLDFWLDATLLEQRAKVARVLKEAMEKSVNQSKH